MTVKLRTMLESEYESYLSVAVKDYAKDKIAAGTWGENDALRLSEESFQRLLPRGINTPKEFLYAIVDEEIDKNIGFLWVHLDKSKELSKFFIYDFIIFESFRNSGYGTKTLACLDEIAKEMSVSQIDLHVFAHNKSAIHLYEKVGFIPTDISMSKQI